MRYSLFKAAAVTLLSLGGSFFTQGFPSPTRDISSLDLAKRSDGWDQLDRRTRSAVPDITRSYTIDPALETPSGDGWTLYWIVPSVFDNVEGLSKEEIHTLYGAAEIGYNIASKSMGVLQANTKMPQNRPRVPLREMLLSLWKDHAKQRLANLKHIVYQNIQNDEVVSALREAIVKMGNPKSKQVTVKASATADPEKETFELLSNTVFGIGAAKMVNDYVGMEGRTVVSITVSTMWDLRMTINLS
jgi:hypothetical protein